MAIDFSGRDAMRLGMGLRRAIIAALALGIVPVSLGGSSRASAEDLAITEINVYATPGKPLSRLHPTKPAEQITVRKEGSKYILRFLANLDEATETQTEISASEWQELADIVREQSLFSFIPLEAGTVTYDYGSEGFSVQGARSNRREWQQEIQNPEPPAVLFRRLVRLCTDKIKNIRVFYLNR